MAQDSPGNGGNLCLFDEGMTEDEILAAGEEIKGWKEVRQAEYTSARKPGIHLRLST